MLKENRRGNTVIALAREGTLRAGTESITLCVERE